VADFVGLPLAVRSRDIVTSLQARVAEGPQKQRAAAKGDGAQTCYAIGTRRAM